MRRSAIISLVITGASLVACSKQDNTNSGPVDLQTTGNQKVTGMKSLVSIVEIPTMDFSRAKDFYEKILGIRIDEVEFGGMKLGIFESPEGSPTVQLVAADGYQPSPDGTVVYLNGGSDLQKVLDKVELNGGTTVIPKTEIGPDMGFYAVFSDTEGNKLGLHSMN